MEWWYPKAFTMIKQLKISCLLSTCIQIVLLNPVTSQSSDLIYDGRSHPLYPALLDTPPPIPSPFTTADGVEVIVAGTTAGKYAIVAVTLANNAKQGHQLKADTADFPTLAATGRHAEIELAATHTITGRSIAEITELGRPGRLSGSGFMSEDEDIISVLRGDNRLVAALGLTHRHLARPLFHVWNLILTDVDLGRWNMTEHRWGNIHFLNYNGERVLVDARDSKGGQLSIFDDGLEGAFHIQIKRELTQAEATYLAQNYAHLAPAQLETLRSKLGEINTGEMEAYYIAWYGFYEGHTFWRADPLAIAFIFGLKSLEEIDRAAGGDLYGILTSNFIN